MLQVKEQATIIGAFSTNASSMVRIYKPLSGHAHIVSIKTID